MYLRGITEDGFDEISNAGNRQTPPYACLNAGEGSVIRTDWADKAPAYVPAPIPARSERPVPAWIDFRRENSESRM